MHIRLFKYLLMFFWMVFLSGATVHPIYVSVTEIEHNAKEKTLEVSCKIFSNDFENVLKKQTAQHVDLINPSNKDLVNQLIRQYVQAHLKIWLSGRQQTLQYIGYEISEEAVWCYFQAENVPTCTSITIQDNILYEYKSEQISLLHVIVDGNRKSTKLNNPEDKVTLQF